MGKIFLRNEDYLARFEAACKALDKPMRQLYYDTGTEAWPSKRIGYRSTDSHLYSTIRSTVVDIFKAIGIENESTITDPKDNDGEDRV